MPTEYIKPILLPVMFLVLCLTPPALAQTNEPSTGKFNEFGDVLPTEMAARLDNFAIELQNNPNARGFMIVYRAHRDLPGLSSRRVNWMRGYLLYNRGFKSDRIVAIDGGTASCLSHELWIALPGAAPKARADAYARGFDDTDAARKYDEYYWDAPHDLPESFSIEYGGSLEGFAQALRKEPRALAYIIAYEEYRINRWEEEDERGRKKSYRQVYIDPPGTAWKKLRSVKTELVKESGISPIRVKLVNGGHRRMRQIELWIVPHGEHLPIPTPNAFPPKRKRR